MKKYLVEVKKGYETVINFETIVVGDSTQTPVGNHSIPWRVNEGTAVFKFKKAALAFEDMVNKDGGIAVYLGANN